MAIMHFGPIWNGRFGLKGAYWLAALVVLLIAGVLETVEAADSPSHVSSGRFSSEPIQPIPSQPIQPAEIVSLGRKLFEDPRLSTDISVSCASCHPLNKAGVDGL
jgi:cytochrome c peroxidase